MGRVDPTRTRRFERADLPLVVTALAVVATARYVRVPEVLTAMASPLIGAPVVAVSIWWGLSRHSRVVLAVVLVVVVVVRADGEIRSLERPLPAGPVRGVARVVTDPVVRNFDVRAVLALDGRRYVASMPSAAGGAFRRVEVGERVVVEGTARPLDGAPHGWVLSNHLAGRLGLTSLVRVGSAPVWYRVANSLRGLITRSAASMSSEDRSLYLGLVIGDDRGQSEMQRYWFKASGLAHLLAVSGQNVAFVLALVSPLTRRAGPRAALLVTLPLLGVFALVTRAEPSVLRAVVMASIGLVAVAAGRKAQGLRVLALTVVALVVLDPLITHSMAFMLSVSATLGLMVLTDPLARWLRGPPRFTEPLSVTVAAQLATAPLLFTMTGSLPSVATIANLAAVPVSGFVMMAGLTVGLVAGSIRADLGEVLMWPVGLMVRWVGWVAETASRLPFAHMTIQRLGVVSVVVVVVRAMVRSATRGIRDAPVAADTGPLSRWAARLIGVVVVALVVLPLPVAPGRTVLTGGATLLRSPCGRSSILLERGVDGVAVLEAMDLHGVTSVDEIRHDGSRSAEKAAHHLARQYRVERIEETDGTVPEDGSEDDREPVREEGDCH